MESLIPINIVIADRSYRIKIAPKDEEVVRQTLKLINDKILEFKTQYAGKDMQDYISMVILWYATTQQDRAPLALQEVYEQELEQMEKAIDKVLNNKD